MWFNKKRLLIVALLISVLAPIYAENLVIMHTNDTHANIDPDFSDKGGVLRRKVIIDSIRNANKNTLLVDAGDVVTGTMYSVLFGGAMEYPLMDKMGYDIMILGNHEFDLGIDSLAKVYGKSKAVKISTNYDLTNTPLKDLFVPYLVKEYDGKKIGFIGANLNPEGMISSTSSRGVVYKDAIKEADATAEMLKKDKGVDMVVMVSHLGYDNKNDDLATDVKVVKNSRYIDVVIGGHSHTLLNPASPTTKPYLIKNADGKDVLVAQTGSGGTSLGVVDIDLDNLTAKSKLIPVTKQYDNRVDTALQNWIQPYKVKVDDIMNFAIAQSAKEMPSRKLGALSNWVADVAKTFGDSLNGAPVDFAIMNKGGIRRSMPRGDVSEGVLRSMFPFDNRVVVLKIKGSDIIDALAVMAERYGDAVSKELKVLYNNKNQIVSAKLNGKQIKKDKYYTIATIDYLASGGDYMLPLKKGQLLYKSNVKLADQIVDYVRQLGAKGIIINSTDESRMYRK